MNKGLLKRLLHDIFCILVVPHYSPRDMEDRVCGLFAKNFEGGRISRFCNKKKCIFVSCIGASLGWPARSTPVVSFQILCGHAAAPLKQSQRVVPSLRIRASDRSPWS